MSAGVVPKNVLLTWKTPRCVTVLIQGFCFKCSSTCPQMSLLFNWFNTIRQEWCGHFLIWWKLSQKRIGLTGQLFGLHWHLLCWDFLFPSTAFCVTEEIVFFFSPIIQNKQHSFYVLTLNSLYTFVFAISYIVFPLSFSARRLRSRAEERLRSLAPPSMKTAARKHQAQKMIPTLSEDHGVFHIVSTFSHTETFTVRVPFLFVWTETYHTIIPVSVLVLSSFL